MNYCLIIALFVKTSSQFIITTTLSVPIRQVALVLVQMKLLGQPHDLQNHPYPIYQFFTTHIQQENPLVNPHHSTYHFHIILLQLVHL